MATEKFIRGKVDSCHHDGKYANTKRLQQAEYHQQHWQEEVEMIEGQHYDVTKKPHRNVDTIMQKKPAS